MKKIFVITFSFIITILLLLLVTALIIPGRIVKTAVETTGPSVIGAPVSLEHVGLSVFSGRAAVSNLVVGNLPDYAGANLFRMGFLSLHISPASLFSENIVIHQIVIDAPHINYEVRGTSSNIGTLLDQLKAKEQQTEEELESGKNIFIKELTIRNARVSVRATMLGDRALTIILPNITLKNLGGEKQSAIEMISTVLDAVFRAIMLNLAASTEYAGLAIQKGAAMTGAGINAVMEKSGDISRTATEQTVNAGRSLLNALPFPGGNRNNSTNITQKPKAE